ncbi:MAG: glycosyltransferase family 4 protein, partial [Lachnospiraceae bacterium]|nr:glycosyltransferase family 4 protein [Lachnospiraceae bacterium]
MSAVVNSYYACGLDRQVELTYLPTMRDGGKLRKALVFAGAYLRFASLMKRADILHVHLSPRSSYARKALLIKRAHRMGKRIVLHQHGGDFERFYEQESDARKQADIRAVFAMADIVIVLSEEWRAFFANGICDPAKIVVLHNGVTLPDEAKTDYRDHNVLVLGKLWEQKGIYDLIAAMPAVLQQVPDAQFLLCGDGDMAECRKRIQELGCSDHVRMPGWIDAQAREELFGVCSTFILPSHFEGMPMSLLEAMGHGLSCIATDVGGIPQVIRNGENGILIRPKDPDAIASALIPLLKDAAL